jgi:hypothetical protein
MNSALPAIREWTSKLLVLEETNRSKIQRFCLISVVAYFFGRLLFFAFTANPFIPPDEATHVGVIHYFAKFNFLPVNTAESGVLGLITNVPYLYYYLMGKLESLWSMPSFDLQFLRFLNILLSFGTILYTWRLATLVAGRKSWIPVLSIVGLTNTPMFSYLSASVSYDNMANLFAAMSIYYCVKFLHSGVNSALVKGIAALCAGTLTKITLLPLALILTIAFIYHFRQKMTISLSDIKLKSIVSAIRQFGKRDKIWGVLAAVLLCLNIFLYGLNVIKYGKVVPEASQVVGLDQAIRYRTFARDYIFSEYKEGRLSYKQAIRATEIINHPADRQMARFLVDKLNYLKSTGWQPMDIVAYLPTWSLMMLNGTMTIAGHRFMSRSNFWMTFYSLLALCSLLAYIRTFHRRSENAIITNLAWITAAYLFVLFVLNYHYYLYYWDAQIGVQGRYCFPIIAPIWVLALSFLSRFKNLFLGFNVALVLPIIVLFIIGDFPYYLMHAGTEWYL